VARRAELAPLAAERHEELGSTLRAAHTSKPVLEQPAVQESAHGLPRRGTQRTVRRLEALFVHTLEGLEVIDEDAVQQ
jgi:hypothetical protein